MSAIREARRSEAGLLADIISRANQDVAQRLGLTPENCPKHPSNCRVRLGGRGPGQRRDLFYYGIGR